jgi:drug/metabolite transporter (DMT)-like permease
VGFLLTGNALLALLAAAFWGVGDFSGGMGAKATGGTTGAALRVVLLSHATSLCVLLAIALASGNPFPHGVQLVAGLAAGVAGGLSLVAFYVALSRGDMGASAAISGLLAAAIPVLVGVFAEGSPGPRRILGFLVAGLAIWLIAAGDAAHEERSTTILAILAGVGFGLYFTALKFASPAGLFWPMANARMASITTCGLILLILRTRAGKAAISRKTLLWVLSTALFDTSGNLLFLAATRAGRLDVASVLASLYPASTILLAAGLLKEWPSRRQGFGMAVAAAAVILIVL